MHIEVNVTKSLVRHLYGTNDNQQLRDDCEEVGVLRHAWMQVGQGDRIEIPSANWVLSTQDRKAMNKIFSTLRFPTGYGAKFRSSCSKDDAYPPHGLKLYDYHKLMQHLLPVALRACFQTPETRVLREAIYDLSNIFRYIYFFARL